MRLESGSSARERMPMGAIGSRGFSRQFSIPGSPVGTTEPSGASGRTISRDPLPLRVRIVGAAVEPRPLVEGMKLPPRFPVLVSVDSPYLVPPSGKIGGIGRPAQARHTQVNRQRNLLH